MGRRKLLASNGLVIAWPELTKLAQAARTAPPAAQGELLSMVTDGRFETRTSRRQPAVSRRPLGPLVGATSATRQGVGASRTRLAARPRPDEQLERPACLARHHVGPVERRLSRIIQGTRATSSASSGPSTNQWAHNEQFSSNDAVRALDSVERLLNAVSAGDQAAEIGAMRMDLMRVMFDEQRRQEMRKKSFQATEGKPQGGLKGWREVVTPLTPTSPPAAAAGRVRGRPLAGLSRRGDRRIQNRPGSFRRTFLTEVCIDCSPRPCSVC